MRSEPKIKKLNKSQTDHNKIARLAHLDAIESMRDRCVRLMFDSIFDDQNSIQVKIWHSG